MSKTPQWFAAVALVVVALAWGYQQLAMAQASGGAAPKWEYKSVKDGLSEHSLNVLGSEGWELVAVEPATPYMFQAGETRHSSRVFYLKRRK
jgi:hypothetical protein